MMIHTLRFGILVLFLSSAFARQKHRGCISDDEPSAHLSKALSRSLRHTEHHQTRLQTRSVHHESCSDFTQRIYSKEISKRSLSPWSLRRKTDFSLIPSTYEEAECLCRGCVINGTENTDYNSVPVMQTFMFLKKEVCPTDSTKYSLKVVYKTLPVACTCVVPTR